MTSNDLFFFKFSRIRNGYIGLDKSAMDIVISSFRKKENFD